MLFLVALAFIGRAPQPWVFLLPNHGMQGWLVADTISFRGFVIPMFGEDGFAPGRKNHFALIGRAAIFNLDKTVDESVFPYRVPRTGTLPRPDRLIVGPLTA